MDERFAKSDERFLEFRKEMDERFANLIKETRMSSSPKKTVNH